MSLDPQVNQDAANAAAAAALAAKTLEPAFPWSRVSFDPFFFGLGVDPLPPSQIAEDATAPDSPAV